LILIIRYLPKDVTDGANPGEDTDDGVIKLAYEPEGDGAGWYCTLRGLAELGLGVFM